MSISRGLRISFDPHDQIDPTDPNDLLESNDPVDLNNPADQIQRAIFRAIQVSILSTVENLGKCITGVVLQYLCLK